MNVGVYLTIGIVTALVAAIFAWVMGYNLLTVALAYVSGGAVATLVAAFASLLIKRKCAKRSADIPGSHAKRPSRAGRQAPS